MSASRINLILYLLALAVFVLLLDHYYRLRDRYYEEYLRYKEVMILLKNYQTRQKAQVDENFLRQKFSQVNAELVSFRQVDVGYEVKGKNLRGSKLPELIYSLETSGVEILKFRAVDNTGQGLYEVEIVLR